MSARDGGPAYPCEVFDTAVDGMQQTYGMSLRDYFAAAVVNGLMQLARPTDTDWNPAIDASCAYQVADAMLAERDK